MELLLFLTVKSKNSVNLSRETREILVYHITFSVFGKVRELVGEIKYAFVMITNKKQPTIYCCSIIVISGTAPSTNFPYNVII